MYRADTVPEVPIALELRLLIKSPQGAVREVSFTRPLIKIGKLHSCHLKLDGTDVSRLHAIIEAEPSKPITLIDLGSEVGTFVNGQRINKAELQVGDKIQIGGFKIALAAIDED